MATSKQQGSTPRKRPHIALKQQVKRFREEVVADRDAAHAQGVQVCGLFIDRDQRRHRAVVVCHRDSDRKAVEAVVKTYFGAFPHVVKYIDERAKGTLASGNGIADTQGGFGTVGGFFFRKGMGDQVFGVSNNHVIAGCNSVEIGTPIFDTDGQRLGVLSAFVPLVQPPAPNTLDMAVFAIDPGIETEWRPFPPTTLWKEGVHLPVTKIGAKTEIQTFGRVKSIDGFVEVTLLGELFSFEAVVTIEGDDGFFSEEGDSGSMVFTTDGRLVGILFAISGNFSYLCPVKKFKGLGLLTQVGA
jgi:hypothetical protein